MTVVAPAATPGGAPPVPERSPSRRAGLSYGGPGAPGTRLLAGPPGSAGAESLVAHVERLGGVPPDARGRALRDAVRESGLGGRGGSGYPTAAKMEAAAARPGPRLMVVNASESEPASRKDRTLIGLRPHLVLDGAVLAAQAIDAEEVVVQLHRGDLAGRTALVRALAERARLGADQMQIRLSLGPDRFVAGESSAVVSFLEGRGARPRSGPPAAVSGVHGRPTLVQNAETVAHVALIARFGSRWFLGAGSPHAPGSVVVTVQGEVDRPGTVLEVWGPATIGELLASTNEAGWSSREVAGALLVGGYGGTWADIAAAWRLPVLRDELAHAGLPLGCGLLGFLSPDRCGLALTARLLTYLAGESAGQCGPCALGLPEMARRMTELAAGRLSRSGLRRLCSLADAVTGRGGCAHPDGAVRLLESALDTFSEDVRRHVRHKPCRNPADAGGFPIPAARGGWS